LHSFLVTKIMCSHLLEEVHDARTEQDG
jgi:hypothetical protein